MMPYDPMLAGLPPETLYTTASSMVPPPPASGVIPPPVAPQQSPVGTDTTSTNSAQAPQASTTAADPYANLPNFVSSYNKKHGGLLSFKPEEQVNLYSFNPYETYSDNTETLLAPNVAFSAVNCVPDCENTTGKSGLPLSVIVTPYYASSFNSIEGNPERCGRCRSYRCATASVSNLEWTCQFCGRRNKIDTNNKTIEATKAPEHNETGAGSSMFLPPGVDLNSSSPNLPASPVDGQKLPPIVEYITDEENYRYQGPLRFGNSKDFVPSCIPLMQPEKHNVAGLGGVNTIVQVVLIDISLPALYSGLTNVTLRGIKAYLTKLKNGGKLTQKRLLLATYNSNYITYRHILTRRKHIVPAKKVSEWNLDGTKDQAKNQPIFKLKREKEAVTYTGIPLPMKYACPLLTNEPYTIKDPEEKRSTIDMMLEVVNDIEAEVAGLLVQQLPGQVDVLSMNYAVPGVVIVYYLLGLCASLRNIGGQVTMVMAESIGSVSEETNMFYDVASICRSCGVCVDCVCLRTARGLQNDPAQDENGYGSLLGPLCYRTGGHMFFDSLLPFVPKMVVTNQTIEPLTTPSTGILDRLFAFIIDCISAPIALNATIITRVGCSVSVRKTTGMGTLATRSALGRMMVGPGTSSGLQKTMEKGVFTAADEEKESDNGVIYVPGIHLNTPYEVFYKMDVAISDSVTSVMFQNAVLFTSSVDGLRHVRVTTTCLPIIRTTLQLLRQVNETSLLYSTCSYGAHTIFETISSKKATSDSLLGTIANACTAATKGINTYRLVQPLAVYKKLLVNEKTDCAPDMLMFPEYLQSYPAALLGVFSRNIFVSQNISFMAADMLRVLATPPMMVVRDSYPAIIDVTELIQMNKGWAKGAQPQVKIHRPCSRLLNPMAASCYLAWRGDETFMYVGHEFDPRLLQAVFGVQTFSELRSGTYYTSVPTRESELVNHTLVLLSNTAPSSIKYRCIVIPEGKLYPIFARCLTEDGFTKNGALMEFLGQLQTSIAAKLK